MSIHNKTATQAYKSGYGTGGSPNLTEYINRERYGDVASGGGGGGGGGGGQSAIDPADLISTDQYNLINLGSDSKLRVRAADMLFSDPGWLKVVNGKLSAPIEVVTQNGIYYFDPTVLALGASYTYKINKLFQFKKPVKQAILQGKYEVTNGLHLRLPGSTPPPYINIKYQITSGSGATLMVWDQSTGDCVLPAGTTTYNSTGGLSCEVENSQDFVEYRFNPVTLDFQTTGGPGYSVVELQDFTAVGSNHTLANFLRMMLYSQATINASMLYWAAQ